MLKRLLSIGTKKDNVLTGTDRLDIMFGKKGNDTLDGRGGTDFLFGGKGNDKLFGGDGKDFLFGGKGNDELFGGEKNDKLFGGKGDDFLDGGAGSDKLFGDKGDDTFNFNMSENAGAKDFYDGGKGRDTLQLTLTTDQLGSDSVKKDIADFEAFLLRKANANSDDGKVFQFKSFDLSVRNFEALKIVEVGGGNTPPEANPDGVAPDQAILVSEDAVDFSIDVLANDTDADEGDTLELLTAVIADGGFGTATIVGPVGNQVVHYTPGDAYQSLGAGEFADVRIDYTISDGDASASSFAQIRVNGVNDAPVADDDHLGGVPAVKVVNKISVAVIGGAQSTHNELVAHLNTNHSSVIAAKKIDYSVGNDWADMLVGVDVVVLGDSGNIDYQAEVEQLGTLFTELDSFVKGGGGVVTTGPFASALRALDGLPDVPNTVRDTEIKDAADRITPVTREGTPENLDPQQELPVGTPFTSLFNLIPDVITVTGSHPIVDGIPGSYTVQGTTHEVALGIDDNGTATELASFGQFTAIAYDDFGQLDGGRTVYLGTAHLAQEAPAFFPFPFAPSDTRSGDVDDIFVQAVAWAAGARSGTATVTIDGRLLLDADINDPTDTGDTDVDTPHDLLTIGSVSETSALGGAIAFDPDTGLIKIVYALDDAPVGQTDSFTYNVFDGSLSSVAPATVDFTVI